MTMDDKFSWDLITTLKTRRPLKIHGFYKKNYEKDLHTRDDLLSFDNKIVKPAAARGAFSSMLHESHPGQFGMKFLAEFIWWPHILGENITTANIANNLQKPVRTLRCC